MMQFPPGQAALDRQASLLREAAMERLALAAQPGRRATARPGLPSRVLGALRLAGRRTRSQIPPPVRPTTHQSDARL